MIDHPPVGDADEHLLRRRRRRCVRRPGHRGAQLLGRSEEFQEVLLLLFEVGDAPVVRPSISFFGESGSRAHVDSLRRTATRRSAEDPSLMFARDRIAPHPGDPVQPAPLMIERPPPPAVRQALAARAAGRRRRHRRPGGEGGDRRGWRADHRRRAGHRQDGGARRGRGADPRRPAALSHRAPERGRGRAGDWPGPGWPACSTACSTASTSCRRPGRRRSAPPWPSRASTSRSSRSPSPWPRATSSSTPPRTRRWSCSSTTSSGSTRRRAGRCRTSPGACSSSAWRSCRPGAPAPTPTPTPGRRSCLDAVTDDVADAILSDAGVTSGRVRRELVDAGGGIPLVLVEAANMLDADQRAGRVDLPDPLPIGVVRPAGRRPRCWSGSRRPCSRRC